MITDKVEKTVCIVRGTTLNYHESLDKTSRLFFLSRGNVFPSDRLCYQGLHLAAWAAESDKFTYLTSGVVVATAELMNRLEFKIIFRRSLSVGPHNLAS